MARSERPLADLFVDVRLSRRRFGHLLTATVGTAVVSALLAACGGDDDDDADETPVGGSTGGATATSAQSGATTPASATQPSVAASTADAQTTAPADASGLPAKGGTFITADVRIEPQDADPHAANESVSNQIVLALYESLVKYEQGTTDLGPGLAESWETSDDGLEYTFTLRQGVQFQDGNPFDAEAVKFSFDRMHGQGAGPSFVLAGVYDHVEVVDTHTCTIVLTSPSGPFLGGLPKVFIISPEYIKPHITGDEPHATTWMRENWGGGGGTGPFKLAGWERGREMVFDRNPDYWDPERPRVDQVIIREIPEMATQRLQLEKNDVDHYYPPPDDIAALQANSDVQAVLSEAIQELYIQVSQVKPPLDDLKVRQAVALAFDYKTFIEGPHENLAVQAQGPIAPNVIYHDPTVPMLERDLGKAKQLLTEAGHPDGGFELEYIHVQGNQVQVGAGLILQEGLAELGITLTMAELAWPQMVERMQNTDNLMHLYGYYRFPPIAHPDAYLFGLWHTSNQIKGYNGAMYGNQEIDQMMEEARTATSETVAEELYSKLQHRLFDDVAALFLANPLSLNALSKRVENFLYTPTWHQTVNFDTIGVGGA